VGARVGMKRVEDMPTHPTIPGKHIDPETGILPMCEWGSECTRGFVRDERFGSGQVIKGTNRAVSRKWRGVQDSNVKK
jgi:hypothetical protein